VKRKIPPYSKLPVTGPYVEPGKPDPYRHAVFL